MTVRVFAKGALGLAAAAMLCGFTETPPSELSNAGKQFTPAAEMAPADWSDAAEIDRTWRAALVRIPGADGSIIKTTVAGLAKLQAVPQGRFPTVIYLHGCAGLWHGSLRRMNFLAQHGFAVIAPASFARAKYPQSCDPVSHRAGLYRPTLRMRQADAANAIAQAKRLPWVDAANVFLAGLSQGALTTATFKSIDPAHSVRARVVEGWTCNAGWDEYRGVNAPADQPVLTLLGKLDPWFQNPWTEGSCGRFLSQNNGSKSVVYSEAPLSHAHELLDFDTPRQEALALLRRHKK